MCESAASLSNASPCEVTARHEYQGSTHNDQVPGSQALADRTLLKESVRAAIEAAM